MEQNKKLLDQVRDVLSLKHYAYSTEQSYVDWIRRHILFHQKRRPKDMGRAEGKSATALSFRSQFNCGRAKQGKDVTRSQAADCQTLEGHGKAAPLR